MKAAGSGSDEGARAERRPQGARGATFAPTASTALPASAPPFGCFSLAARLTAWYATTTFLLVAAAGVVQYRALDRDLAGEDDRLVVETLVAAERGPGSNAIPMTASARDAALGPLVRELDRDCRVVRGAWPVSAPPPLCPPTTVVREGTSPDSLTGGAVFRSWRSPTGRTWRIAAGPPDAAGHRLEVALDRWTDDRVLADYRRKLSFVLAATLVLSAALGYALARRGLAPLRLLGQRMATVSARSLDQRIDRIPDAPDEVQSLVATFDAMLDRLQGAFTALSQFSAELAHEFRTPLHILRQQTEVALAQHRTPSAYREVLGSTLEEIERLRRLVDDTLFLARAEDPRATIPRTPLNVASELREVADYLMALAEDRSVLLTVDAPSVLVVSADRTLFRRALVNVVTNAIRHTPAAGQVALEGRATDSGVVVEVRDTGEGMPPEALARVFERYFRASAAGSDANGSEGAGLGLAIVRGIMRLHGGTAEAESTMGIGTRLRLTFPE